MMSCSGHLIKSVASSLTKQNIFSPVDLLVPVEIVKRVSLFTSI